MSFIDVRPGISVSHTAFKSDSRGRIHLPPPTSSPFSRSQIHRIGELLPYNRYSNQSRSFAFITHSTETYKKHEPRIDNTAPAGRKRRRTTQRELFLLRSAFQRNSLLDKTTRMELAAQCHMTEKAVQVWFQNQRSALRKKNLRVEDNERASKRCALAPLSANT